MGRGSSGLKSSGVASQKANTPSGVSYSQFMQMSDDQKYQTIDTILNDSNIQVPSYLDSSRTSKVVYALGMDNKPTVVSDMFRCRCDVHPQEPRCHCPVL